MTCRVLQLARQPYYRWRTNPTGVRAKLRAQRTEALYDAHRMFPEFGHRQLAEEARDAGVPISDRTAWKITSENGWFSSRSSAMHQFAEAEGFADRVEARRPTATAPNEHWVVTVTEHAASDGLVFFCTIADAFSHRVVGWALRDTRSPALVAAALEQAVTARSDIRGCHVHGVDSAGVSGGLRRAIARAGLTVCVGCETIDIVDAAEDPVTELARLLADSGATKRRDRMRTEIIEWLDGTYHLRRPQSTLGGLTPIEYEAVMAPTAFRAW